MPLDIRLPKDRLRGEKWKNCVLCSTTRYWPKSMLTERDGKWYCKDHYRFKFARADEDAIVLDVDDGDRGEP